MTDIRDILKYFELPFLEDLPKMTDFLSTWPVTTIFCILGRAKDVFPLFWIIPSIQTRHQLINPPPQFFGCCHPKHSLPNNSKIINSYLCHLSQVLLLTHYTLPPISNIPTKYPILPLLWISTPLLPFLSQLQFWNVPLPSLRCRPRQDQTKGITTLR